MSQERRAGGGGGDGGNRRQRSRKNRPVLDFSIKVTNLRRGMRIKDLKAELRKRECNPLGITWKGTKYIVKLFVFIYLFFVLLPPFHHFIFVNSVHRSLFLAFR